MRGVLHLPKPHALVAPACAHGRLAPQGVESGYGGLVPEESLDVPEDGGGEVVDVEVAVVRGGVELEGGGGGGGGDLSGDGAGDLAGG